MCMMVYLAANKPLPLVPRDEQNPSFNVSELNVAYSNGVERQFRKTYIYEVGAYGGCGCGFSYGQYEGADEQEEAASRESVRRLSEYLSEAKKEAGLLELYACWDGDQHLPPDRRIVLRLSEIGGDKFQFEERTYARVVTDDPAMRMIRGTKGR
jgi:hypothetical protein